MTSTNNIQNEVLSTPVKSSVLSNNMSVCPSLQNFISTLTTSAIDLVKSCVIYPDKKNGNSIKKKEYIPSVLTSEKLQEIMVAKEAEKEIKEKKKRIRQDKIKKKASSLNKRRESSTYEEQLMKLSESTSENEDWIPDTRPSGFEELEKSPKGDYVLVEFKSIKIFCAIMLGGFFVKRTKVTI